MNLLAIAPYYALLCFCVSFYYVILHGFRRAGMPLAHCHSPPTYPIVGCLISFYKNRGRLLEWYTDLLSESPTQTIVVSRFGARRTIVTANPRNVEYILKTNFSNYPKGEPFTQILGDFLGTGIFNVDGDHWYNQRQLASHEFISKSFRDYAFDALKEQVENKLSPVMDSLLVETGDEVMDLQDLLRRLGFDIICKVILGVDTCALNNSQYASRLMEAFDNASEICAKRGAAPVFAIWKAKRLLRIGSERSLKDSVGQIHSFFRDVVGEKRRKLAEARRVEEDEVSRGPGEDLITKMIMAGNNDEVIRDMMISFIMAGKDTTSAAMTWFFYLLSGHPDIEQELVKEIGFVENSDGLSNYESLQKLRLLKACLCESMRLYPPVAWDSKHAVANDLLPDGTPISAGDRVTYFPYGMGRMECLWGKDWFEFRPERWVLDRDGGGVTVTTLKNVCPYKFPVFQAGPRVCLGKELAFIHMKYIVASLLKRFEIRPASSRQAVFVPFLTAFMAGGFKVLVRRRGR